MIPARPSIGAGHLLSARVEIDGCAVRFETDCEGALGSLDRVLRSTLRGAYYTHAVARPDPAERVPTFRYLDAPVYDAVHDAEGDTCTFTAPWGEIGDTSVLAMWLFYVSELVRQRRGEYLLHASAVARDDRAVVLFGPSECGKTTCALDLCLRHGFRLFGNNRLKVGLRDGQPRLLRGDAELNLRLNSLRSYSETLSSQVFGEAGQDGRRLRRKRRVAPAALGIETAGPAPAIAVFVFLTLDSQAPTVPVRPVAADVNSHNAFRAVSGLYQELSSMIRGTTFVPFALRAGAVPFFVPSLDAPDFVETRVAFLDALLAASDVVKIRAPLDHAVAEVLRLFDRA